MAYWQNYRALKAKGMVEAVGVEAAGVDREVAVTLRKEWNPRTLDFEDVRETLSLEEARIREADLLDELQDLQAWIADMTPEVETFRAERVAAKAVQEEALRLQEAEAQALADETAREQEQPESAIIIHPAKGKNQ